MPSGGGLLLPSKTVVARTPVGLQRRDAVVALRCAAISAVLTSTLVEAGTDRDWSVQGWEWPEVMAAASVMTLGLFWLVSVRTSPRSAEPGGFAKQLVKAELQHLGYTIQRLPSPAFDPQLALQIDFDYVLDHYLASRDDPRPFFFLQVGAYEGITDDPLHERVREGAWHGILVEPQPSHFRRLMENYAGVEGLRFINAAVSEQPGLRRMFVIHDETGTPIEYLGGLTSFREEPVRRFHERMASEYPGSTIGSIEVPSTTFGDVLADASYLDLLQIDVEGYDLELLKLFDFGRIKPPIVRFEHRHLSANERDEAVELLAEHGYRMMREEYDTTAYSAPSRTR
jgi:FkbM family methyltransferase